FIATTSLVFCGAILAQKVHFAPVEKSSILQRMKSIPTSDAERAAELKELFLQAGCVGKALSEQRIDGAETPNIICRLGDGEGNAVIVGAHYDRVSSAQRPLDNWSGASLLPALYESLHQTKRDHNFVFVAFADHGNDPAGAEFFARHLTSAE